VSAVGRVIVNRHLDQVDGIPGVDAEPWLYVFMVTLIWE
jgi:hypothetical protein